MAGRLLLLLAVALLPTTTPASEWPGGRAHYRPPPAAFVPSAVWKQIRDGEDSQVAAIDFMEPQWLQTSAADVAPANGEVWDFDKIGAATYGNCGFVTGRYVANAGLDDNTGVMCIANALTGFAAVPPSISERKVLSFRVKMLTGFSGQYSAVGWAQATGASYDNTTDNRLEPSAGVFYEYTGGACSVVVYGPDVSGSPTATSTAPTCPPVNTYTTITLVMNVTSNTAADMSLEVWQGAVLIDTITDGSNRLFSWTGLYSFFLLAQNEGSVGNGPAVDTAVIATDRPPDN